MNPQAKRSKVTSLATKQQIIPFTEQPTPAFGLFFQYSPEQSLITAWYGESEDLLGVSVEALSQHGDLFLKYTHPDDRFKILEELEKLIRGDQKIFSVLYRWYKPPNDDLITLHCQAETRTSGLIEGIIFAVDTPK